jgi:hypothetical protein
VLALLADWATYVTIYFRSKNDHLTIGNSISFTNTYLQGCGVNFTNRVHISNKAEGNPGVRVLSKIRYFPLNSEMGYQLVMLWMRHVSKKNFKQKEGKEQMIMTDTSKTLHFLRFL